MRWWRRRRGRRQIGYPRVRFRVVGDSLVPREWAAAGHAGPLEWSAHLERIPDGVAWSLDVAGTLIGTELRSGRAANQYAAADEHNAFADVADG